MYPRSTKELQRALAPKQLQAFQEFGRQVFCRRGAERESEAAHCRRRRSYDAMSLLHPRPLGRCPEIRGGGGREYGSDLGRGRDAGRRSVCPFGDRTRGDPEARRRAAIMGDRFSCNSPFSARIRASRILQGVSDMSVKNEVATTELDRLPTISTIRTGGRILSNPYSTAW